MGVLDEVEAILREKVFGAQVELVQRTTLDALVRYVRAAESVFKSLASGKSVNTITPCWAALQSARRELGIGEKE